MRSSWLALDVLIVNINNNKDYAPCLVPWLAPNSRIYVFMSSGHFNGYKATDSAPEAAVKIVFRQNVVSVVGHMIPNHSV